MEREEAIEYLESKDKFEARKTFNDKEEADIQEVMKRGKIYGDPVCECQ